MHTSTVKTFAIIAALAVSVAPLICRADGDAPASAMSEKDKATVEKHAKPIFKALNLNDAAKEDKIREILGPHLMALNEWHAKNDPELKQLWAEFNKARSDKDDAKADAALAKIDGVYASFKPQHDDFHKKLGTVLTPSQIESVEDGMTENKLNITYKAYGEIFHGLTDKQNAFIMEKLKAARSQAMDSSGSKEMSSFFKKYKIQIEAYLTAQGYDVKKSYSEFVAKQKAESAAKKPGKSGDAKAAESPKAEQ
jgi:Spy/CpxP family protein refolding chaperone